MCSGISAEVQKDVVVAQNRVDSVLVVDAAAATIPIIV